MTQKGNYMWYEHLPTIIIGFSIGIVIYFFLKKRGKATVVPAERPAMLSKESQQQIIAYLIPKLQQQHGFVLKKTSYTGERYAEFECRQGDALYQWTISFKRYGKVDATLLVYYDAIRSLYQQLSAKVNGGANFVFAVRFNNYLHPKNANGFFNTGQTIESPFQEEICAGQKLEVVAETICGTYFENVVPIVIAQTDTLPKADAVINNLSNGVDMAGDPKLLIYTSSLVDQMLNGILLAKLCHNPYYNELKAVYLKCANRLDDGNNPKIKLMREAIQK